MSDCRVEKFQQVGSLKIVVLYLIASDNMILQCIPASHARWLLPVIIPVILAGHNSN